MTQVRTWFANARRRLKEKNRMTWNRPDNGTDEGSTVDVKETEIGRLLTQKSFSNISSLSTRTIIDEGAIPCPDSTQSIQTAPSSSHLIPSLSHMMTPSNSLSPSHQMSPQINLSQQTGDWQYDIDPNLVTAYVQDSNYDPEEFFNEHLSHMIHTLWS